MFRLFSNNADAVSPLVLMDLHTTRPGQGTPAIVRNGHNALHADGESDLFDRARQIYKRARHASERQGDASYLIWG